MDPKATIDRINEAIASNDWDEVQAASGDLADWIADGGECEIDGKTSQWWNQWACGLWAAFSKAISS